MMYFTLSLSKVAFGISLPKMSIYCVGNVIKSRIIVELVIYTGIWLSARDIYQNNGTVTSLQAYTSCIYSNELSLSIYISGVSLPTRSFMFTSYVKTAQGD